MTKQNNNCKKCHYYNNERNRGTKEQRKGNIPLMASH